jgi:membrane protease subunit HflK
LRFDNAEVTAMNDARDLIQQLIGDKGTRRQGARMPTLGGAPILLVLAVVLVLWGAISSFYTVQPEERAVVKRFGRVVGITDPGLHFKWPFGIDQVQIVATERVLKQEFGFRTEAVSARERTQFADRDFPGESLMLTGDLNIIQVEWVVQYRIADPIKFLYAMREPTSTLRDLSESVMRRIVGNRIGSDVLTVGRVDIANTAREEIQSAMDRYDNGIYVITVELQDVVPPPRVQPAFNEVNEARQELERMVNEANRQANQAIPRAEGTAKRVIAEAEGYATERVNRALGEAARFTAVLNEYRNVPDVTRSRLYLEALNDALPQIGSVLVIQEGQVSPLPLLNLRDAQPPVRAQQPQPPPQAAPAAAPTPEAQAQTARSSR